VFHKIDRNARNEYDYYETKKELEALGIRQEYSGQNIDTTTPEGQFLENSIVGISAFYSRNLAKETKKGMNENAYKAQFNGGVPPFGYSITQDKHYIINEMEAPAIRLIFSMFNSNHSYGTIISALNDRKFLTRRGKEFGKNSLYEIITNPKYMGTYTFNSVPKNINKKRNSHIKEKPEDYIEIKNAIPAIISEMEFMKAQDKLSKRVKVSRIENDSDYILSGYLRCGICGCAITGHTLTKKGKKYQYYSCSGKERGHKCSSHYLPKKKLEKAVFDYLSHDIFTTGTNSGLIKRFMFLQEHVPKANSEIIKTAKREEKLLKGRLNNLYVALENGQMDEFDMEHIRTVKDKILSVQKRILEEEQKEKASPITEEAVLERINNFINTVKSKKTLSQ